MQSWETDEAKADRYKQTNQFIQFINSCPIDPNEPVLLVGDFNTDMISEKNETENIFRTLKAVLPVNINEQIYTIDPSTNLLVGRDGGDSECLVEYEASWGTPINSVYNPSNSTRVACNSRPGVLCYCPCCLFQVLDYILYSSAYQIPFISPTLQVIPVKVDPFQVVWTKRGLDVSKYMTLVDLSDHYPVIAKFQFNYVKEPKNWGAKNCQYNDTNLSVGLLWLFLLVGIGSVFLFAILFMSYRFCDCCKSLRKRAKKALLSEKTIDLTTYDADQDEEEDAQSLIDQDEDLLPEIMDDFY